MFADLITSSSLSAVEISVLLSIVTQVRAKSDRICFPTLILMNQIKHTNIELFINEITPTKGRRMSRTDESQRKS